MNLLQKWLLGTFFFSSFFIQAQEGNNLPPVTDSLYREDQVYFGITYNIMTGQPAGIENSQFSGGFHAGFIRDMPINQQRNLAIGVGLGWSVDTYGHNVFIGKELNSDNSLFQIMDRGRINFDTNRFTTQSIDMPIQFRWRTSTVEDYKFWRIYAGLKPAYAYYFQTKFEQGGEVYKESDIPEFQRFRLGATFTFGYNTFNFNFYYSLNSFLDGATVNNEHLDLRTFQVGLMFYLL